MLSNLPPDVQAYVVSLVFGLSAPLLIFGMLRLPLRHFLAAIFASEPIEQFWMRLVLVVLVASGISQAVGFQPDKAAATNFVALIWNVADQIRHILDSLLWAMLCLFLPLLLAYTILHAGRRKNEAKESKEV
ncbi:MAG: hypothetical protein HY000_27670 [Planctomycetes bacterium]|nr:hypothetical protein [Planctomycetota bacterium]